MKQNFAAIVNIGKKLNKVLSASQKKRAVLVLIVVLLGAVFELVSVTAILPFLQVLLTPEIVMDNPDIQPLIRFFHIGSSTDMMVWMGIGLVLLYIIKNVYMLLSYFIQFDYSTKIQKELSLRMLRSYVNRPYTYFLDVNSAEIQRGCNDDINGVYNIIYHSFTVIAELLASAAIGIFIIYTEFQIAVAILVLMTLVMLVMILFFKPVMKRMGRKNMTAQAEKVKHIMQIIGGIKEIYVLQRKEVFEKEYEKAADVVRRTQRNYSFISNSPERIIEGVCVSGLIGIVVIRLLMGVDMFTFVPKLGSFAMAAFRILPSVGKITGRIAEITYHLPMLDNVYENVLEGERYGDKEREDGLNSGTEKDHTVEFCNKLQIRHVQWKYPEQIKPVLSDVNITIQKGESIALIGTSGAGKTTLADIILGLLQPQSGGIYLDDKDVYEMPKQWAGMVGYVPQSAFLIDDTIKNNIVFGLLDIPDEKVWKALENAQLKEFVETLPDGLLTVVGERGVKLSGGQRQRIAIARALLCEPEILVLDEATAALDNETETAVMGAIESLQGQVTMIIVAHRLTTIKTCDAIYEICEGKAVYRSREEVLRKA